MLRTTLQTVLYAAVASLGLSTLAGLFCAGYCVGYLEAWDELHVPIVIYRTLDNSAKKVSK